MAAKKERKLLSATGLLGKVRKVFEKIPTIRTNVRGRERNISLADSLMSALAMFNLKSPFMIKDLLMISIKKYLIIALGLSSAIMLIYICSIKCKQHNFIAPEEISELIYTFEPIIKSDKTYLSVDTSIRLKNNNHSHILFQLPAVFGGAFELYNEVTHLESLTPHITIDSTVQPDLKIINNIKENIINIHYDLVPRITSTDQITDSTSHRIIMTSDYFHCVGYALFALPFFNKADQFHMPIHISLN